MGAQFGLPVPVPVWVHGLSFLCSVPVLLGFCLTFDVYFGFTFGWSPSFPFESTVCLKSELFCQLPQSFKQLKTGDFKSEQCVIRAQKVAIQIFHDDDDYIFKLQQKASLWIYLNIWASTFNPYGCLSNKSFKDPNLI